MPGDRELERIARAVAAANRPGEECCEREVDEVE